MPHLLSFFNSRLRKGKLIWNRWALDTSRSCYHPPYWTSWLRFLFCQPNSLGRHRRF
jgi:hypothetical protein